MKWKMEGFHKKRCFCRDFVIEISSYERITLFVIYDFSIGVQKSLHSLVFYKE